LIGRRLSHYEVVADLGAGGMGVVYRAHDTKLNRDVAIKVLPHDKVISDNARSRFKREALAASALNHPNIITIYEVNSDADTDFIVMEYVRGSTLLHLLHKRKLTIEEALGYCGQIADAVSKAHAAGIIHRDLKPGNIMVTDDGLVKVLDFGLAKIDYDSGDSSASGITHSFTLTQPGMITGTVAYMSPEQARGEKVDARSDIFSFGIVMFEALSGQLPFNGPNSIALLHNLHFSPPRDLTQMRPDVPPQIVALIAKMLEKQPEKRVQAMSDVCSVLRGGKSNVLDGPMSWRSRGSGAERLLASAAPLPGKSRFLSKSRTIELSLAILILLLGIGVWYFNHRAKTRSATSVSQELPVDDNAFALYQRARQYLDMWDRSGNVDKAIALLQRGIQLDPQSAVSYAALGEAYCHKNRASPDPQWIKLATDNANKAVALDSDLAASHVTAGMVKEQAGDSSGAEQEYQRAARLDPKSAVPHRNLGRLYAKAGKADLGNEEFRRALELDPKDWGSYVELGVQAYKSGQYKDAASFLEQALKIVPDDISVLVNLGATYHALTRDDDAAAALQRALEIKPDADVYNNLGTIRYYQGHYDEAATAFEKTVSLSANDFNSWASLGDAYRQLHNADKAKQSYQQAIQLVKEEIVKHPDQMELRADLAVYLAKTGDKQGSLQAISAIDLAKEKDPTNLFEIAIAYELCGERDKALNTLTSAVKAGQSLDDIKNEPDLVSLRADPRYHLNVMTAAAAK
jgi:eukaryotic-like serine/threonine-protein kinase